ncbi:uncharacterized protein IUM83_16070 [Phytophthora cinnamomi]|uniref:uncharacterized protein n=1 Tax=Phytophthora cinnamomi TaxID=4785 RepID=UPI0035595DD7|nr:hypothetical protein IUM83_16070 [Phytophthora cinnamomi]
MTNMYASYNKTNNIGALIGNWVEEDALHDRTGYSRRKIPAPLFAPDRKESRIESTHKRVLLHEVSAALTCNSHASEITPPPFETTLQASTRTWVRLLGVCTVNSAHESVKKTSSNVKKQRGLQ